jgi:hypothetical protein
MALDTGFGGMEYKIRPSEMRIFPVFFPVTGNLAERRPGSGASAECGAVGVSLGYSDDQAVGT